MDKLQMQSKNIVDENIEFIAKRFPNCVTEALDEEGKLTKLVDFDMLKQELSHVIIDEDKERYTMTWPDKKQAILTANAPIAKTLRPCREESVDFDHTQNLYIEGDNLDVLKLLRETYLGKIKMIYIDPPYNTGNDFVYNDDFAVDTDEYLERSNQIDDQGNRMVANNDSNGRFHTDWLNMIYPRLKLAKDLLTDDGVILISINSYESENLGKICNEIYGESNYICRFGWETKKAAQGMTTENMVVDNQESIYVYAKNKSLFKFRGLDRDEKNGFSNPDNDPRGLWKRQYLQRLGQGLPVRTIIDPENGTAFSFETPYTQEKLNRWIEENRIIFPTESSKYPARKEFLSEYEYKQQLVTALGLYATKATTEKLYNMFGGEKIFTNPKPDTLIHFLVQQCVTNGTEIVLDFFSGSATTAHAVMQLNAEDGGNRKYIMVQLPEACDEKSEAYKAGYRNICEIGKERIRRAGLMIASKLAGKDLERRENEIKEAFSNTNDLIKTIDNMRLNKTGENRDYKCPVDTGFRDLKLDSSCMKDIYYSPNKTTQDLLTQFEDNIKEDRTSEDLLFQVMLDMGVMLSSEIKTLEINGKKVFNVNDGDLVCCFDKDLNDDVVTAIAKMQPLYAVFRDTSMPTDSVAVNFDQIFETYSPTTTRKVI